MNLQSMVNGELVQHTDGGFYRFKGVAVLEVEARLRNAKGIPVGSQWHVMGRHTNDQSTIVIYQKAGVPHLNYRFIDAQHVASMENLVIYEHIWPFDAGFWGRPVREFEQRFERVFPSDLADAKASDRVSAQARITAARAARRDPATHAQAVARSIGLVEAQLNGMELE